MEFDKNSPWLFAFFGFIILLVVGESVFFMIRALKRSKEIGMDQGKIKKMISTVIICTIAPAIAILIGVIALSDSLGTALPWLRLSVVGALSYETTAASNALEGMGYSISGSTIEGINLTATEFTTVFAVMSICIMLGLWLVPFISEKYQKGMINLEKKDKKWSDILQSSLFIGMISAFLGYVFCNTMNIFVPYKTGTDEAGNAIVLAQSLEYLIPILVFFISALVMVFCGIMMKKFKAKWLNDYALPLSLLIGMASAIPLTYWLNPGFFK